MATSPSGATPGRPRDASLERRITAAAIDLFGETGWAGFSVEAVARRAGAGKASLYLRWRNREELLVGALREQIGDIAEVDTGTVRGDLVHLAQQMFELYLGPGGAAAMRLHVESVRSSAVQERSHALGDSQRLAARAIVHRGIERGELPPGTSVTLLLDTLCGGAMFHALTVLPGTREVALADSAGYARRLADFLLGAAAHAE